MDPGLPEQLSVELHPTRLFRAAEGDHATQAAIILLSHSDTLAHLHCCITVDVDRNLAWLDWNAAITISQHLNQRERALIQLATAIALHASHATQHDHDRQAVALALRHLRL